MRLTKEAGDRQGDQASMGCPGKFFDAFAEKFDSLYDARRGWAMRWLDRHFRSDMLIRFDMTFESLGDLTGRRVLDVGCGSGPYIAEALRRGASHVTGIDPAPAMLSLARRRIAQTGMETRVRLVEGYFPQGCPDERFDFAIVMGVMDYVPNSLDFLRAVRETVAIRAAVSFPSVHWFRTPFRKIRYGLRRCPVYFYTRPQIEALMQETRLMHYSLKKIPGAGMDYFLCMSI